MPHQISSMPRLLRVWIFLVGVMSWVNIAQAAEMADGKMSCPMCGAMGWGRMILGAILILSLIAALVALTIFLIRRSRSSLRTH